MLEGRKRKQRKESRHERRSVAKEAYVYRCEEMKAGTKRRGENLKDRGSVLQLCQGKILRKGRDALKSVAEREPVACLRHHG